MIRNTLRVLAAGRRAEKCRTWGATALRTLCQDPALRARMGAAGRVTIEQEYSLAVTAPRLVGIWRDGVDPAAAVAG